MRQRNHALELIVLDATFGMRNIITHANAFSDHSAN